MSCGGSSSVGRAPGCGPGGRGFKSHLSPQKFRVNVRRAVLAGVCRFWPSPAGSVARERGAAGQREDIPLRKRLPRTGILHARAFCRSVAQSGSAPGLGPGGRRFKSFRSDQFFLPLPPSGHAISPCPAHPLPAVPASKNPRHRRNARVPQREIRAYLRGNTDFSADGTMFALPGARHSEVMPGTSRAMREAS